MNKIKTKVVFESTAQSLKRLTEKITAPKGQLSPIFKNDGTIDYREGEKNGKAWMMVNCQFTAGSINVRFPLFAGELKALPKFTNGSVGEEWAFNQIDAEIKDGEVIEL